MICTNCGHQNSADMKFCTMCRAPLDQRTCSNGHVIPDGLDECPYCPRPQKQSTVLEQPPQAPAAGARRTAMASPEQLRQPPPAPAYATNPPPVSTPPPPDRPPGTVFRMPGSDAPQSPQPTPSQPQQQPQPQPQQPVSAPQQPILVGFLVSFSADKSGQFWPLRHGRTRIGRQPGSDILLDLPDVSSEHATVTARLARNGLRIWIEDRSSNGTIVNGEEIFNERPNLVSNDTIQIGSMVLRLMLIE
jgi:hypothetical protein